ncbi:G-protein coupled receptor-associated protein LMBRD2-like isoform X2 [Branchiostoma lanceolatum]|uniref:G-protein coupled receptor-associated protein LMBRD2-like isoform X2 n=1 Tax=Branchiostoma lanceolatum TaxID=7740 RepID=UPI0034534CA6
MSVAPLAVEVICVFCLAAYLLHKYGNIRRQHVLVTLASLVAWYFSMIIIFILPLDVSTTFYKICLGSIQPPVTPAAILSPPTNATPHANQSYTDAPSSVNATVNDDQSLVRRDALFDTPTCQVPWSYVQEHVLPNMWHVVYWTSQILTWLILPFMQSYATSGDFTIQGKIKTALIENAIYYGSYLLIFGALLIYVAARPDLQIDGPRLKMIGITASNTWGLFLLVLLLGYGLVEVPRKCWTSSNREQLLAYTRFQVAKLSTDKSDAEESLEDVLEEVSKASEAIRYNHPHRKYMDTVLRKVPEDMQARLNRGMDDYEDYPDGRSASIPSEKDLVALHRKTIRAVTGQHRTQIQWDILMERAFGLEDIGESEKCADRRFRSTFPQHYTGILKHICTPTVEWYWKCLVRPWVLKVLTVILAVFSFVVIWSEVTFFNKKPVLSLFAIFINVAAKNYDYFYIELASCLTITYLCVCVYFTVFRIRIFNYYYIAPYHQTDSNSLLFSGILLCRLTPPLCLNFLGMIHLDKHVTGNEDQEIETAYTSIMGHMDVISFLSDGFYIYYPILVIVVALGTFFSVGNRCLGLLGFQQFIGDDDMTSDLIEEGKEMIKREKRKRQRVEDGEARRKSWRDRYGTTKDRASSLQNRDASDSDSGRGSMKSGALYGKAKYSRVKDKDDSAQVELLKDSEPLDYDDSLAENEEFDRAKYTRSQAGRSSRQTTGSRWTGGRGYGSQAPPKGLFDDV